MIWWFVASLTAVQAQAHAEPRAAIDCAVAHIPAAEAEAIGLAMREAGLPSEALMERTADAVVACTPEDPVLRRGAFQGVIAEMMRASLRRHLSDRRIDMDLVDRHFEDLPAEVRTSSSMMEENADVFIEGLLQKGADAQALMASGREIGAYLGARVGVVRARLGLPMGTE